MSITNTNEQLKMNVIRCGTLKKKNFKTIWQTTCLQIPPVPLCL